MPTDAASTNPVSTNPVSTNPVSTNPASTNPASTNPASTNPASTNTEIVQASVAALNAHDLDAVKTFWAADGQERFPDAVCSGPDEIARYFRAVIDALPDLHIEPRAFAAEGHSVFMRHVISGTHTGGPFKGIATTGRRVEVPGIDHFVLRDGRIISNFVVFDQMEMGRQLGLLPPDESTADKALKVAFNGVTGVRRRVAAVRSR